MPKEYWGDGYRVDNEDDMVKIDSSKLTSVTGNKIKALGNGCISMHEDTIGTEEDNLDIVAQMQNSICDLEFRMADIQDKLSRIMKYHGIKD